MNHEYSKHYSEDGFWTKLGRYALKAGRELIERALQLYYTLQEDATPAWAKTVIISALGYFVWPMDLIPDVLPGGFVDDFAVLGAALTTVAMHITEEIRVRAKLKTDEWFGADQ